MAQEIFDYVDNTTSDVNQTLSIDPQAVLTETGDKKDVIHRGDDNDPASTTRLDFSGGHIRFNILIRWDLLNEADAGTVMKFWCDSSYGNGRISSFKFSHPDGHTYVVCFDCLFQRLMRPTLYSVPVCTLEVIGRIAE